ncbi:transcription termination factor 1-like [Girardinichthys multiradiatus]|uniref:transcription termination factor 1-like n=1 Tax=Girardinichthys multiradiatus TaxID=208333 RepID=UPI001FAB87AD|nr:transcription termination factor 1-like [Girardinichthys multiradiatus]
MMERKRKPEIMQEHPAELIGNTPDNKKKRKREEKLGLHHVDELTESQRKKKRRKLASQQEHPAPVNPNTHGEDLKEEEVNLSPSGGLKQCLKKTKKKRHTDEKNILLSTAELMQHQDKKKKKNCEEPCAAVDLDTPMKKKDKEMTEEAIPPPDGPTHDQKKKKKKKKKHCEEPCAAVDLDTPMKKKDKEMKEEAIPPPDGPTHDQKKKKKKKKKKMEMTPAVAFEETNISSTKTKKKRGETMSQENRKKKRTKQGDMKSTHEEEVNRALVEELQEYMPHIKKKCLSQIKKMLRCDLQRFRKFKQQGVLARFGRFSEQENQQIRENIAGFMALTGISSIEKLLFPKRFKEEQVTITRLKKEHRFMERIADEIPRPCQQVYLRALKMFDEKNHMGRFSEEELATLIRFHNLHGNNWKLISEKMDRSAYSLQKRFTTIGVGHGVWSADEERRLKQAVREHLEAQARKGLPGSGLSRDQLCKKLPWREISQKVQTRSWIQCRTKWLFFLEHRLTWYGNVFNRGADGYEAKIHLITTLYNTSVEDAADINWEEVAQAVGEVTTWSVQRMFNRLKQRKVPHSHSLSFQEIIDFLYHHVVPFLQKRLRSHSTSWVGLREQQQQDRYQLIDIFNSDVEDDSDDEEVNNS